ncbi:rho GTPase-activating protein SYDE1 isoform X4 [Stigmatopora nigra]
MAQPLLKRTFSRLRGKERSHGKTEAPGRRRSGPPSPPATSKSRGAEPLSPPMTTKSGEAEPPSLGRVTKRQRWQGRAAPVASPDPVADGRSSSFGSDGWNGASVPRPPTMRPAAAVVVTDEPSVTRTYLQSLDRSSRNWVLSSGKSEALDEGRGSRPESGGGGDDDDDIWYNPIPEEGEASAQMGRSPGPAENVMRAVGKDDAPSGVDDSESQTAVPKRSGVMDRLRSPGTVRRLSLKMRKLPELGRKLSLRSSRAERGGQAAGGAAKSASEHNVLSRYHLDTSAPPTSPRGRSASKGGHLSDGDSPEVGDSGSFPLYRASETSRLCRRTTGLLTVHLVGLDHIGTTKESDGGRDIFLAIQIDGTTRARTSTLNFRGQGIPLNHTFRLELERARLLRVVVLMPGGPAFARLCPPLPALARALGVLVTHSSDPAAGSESDRPKNRICCLGGVAIPSLFEGSRCQRLCVQLEPKGLLYIKLSLREHRDAQCGDGGGGGGDPAAPSKVFGVELRHLMEEEGTTVPLLIQKTVADIERRGLKAVGLYRLCGSAAVKKELRDRFEADSSAVRLGEDLYPDVNVITGRGGSRQPTTPAPTPARRRRRHRGAADLSAGTGEGHFDLPAGTPESGGPLQLLQQDDAPKPGRLLRPGAPQAEPGPRGPNGRALARRRGFQATRRGPALPPALVASALGTNPPGSWRRRRPDPKRILASPGGGGGTSGGGGGGGAASRARRRGPAGQSAPCQSLRRRLERLRAKPSVGTGSGLRRGGRQRRRREGRRLAGGRQRRRAPRRGRRGFGHRGFGRPVQLPAQP